MAFSPLPFEAIQSNASTNRASSINRGNEGMEQFFQDMAMNAKLSRDKSERGLESATYMAKITKDAKQSAALWDAIGGAASLGFNAYATHKGWMKPSSTNSTTSAVASSSINNPNSYQSFKSDVGNLYSGFTNTTGNIWSGIQNYTGHALQGFYDYNNSPFSSLGGGYGY